MIRKFQYRMHEREVQQLNGKANEIVRHKLTNALSNDVSSMVSFSEEQVDAMYGEKERLYTTQFVIMPQSHYEHVLQMLNVLKMSVSKESQILIDEIKNEIAYK